MAHVITAVRVDPDKAATKIEIENSLEAFQSIVGGYIEPVPHSLSREFTIYVNEEGLIQDLPLNGGTGLICSMPLFGTALFVGPVDSEGHDTDVPAQILDYYNLKG